MGWPTSILGLSGFLEHRKLQEGKREAVRAAGGGGRALPGLWEAESFQPSPCALRAAGIATASAQLTFVRSTPVMARTEAGTSARRRFTSDMVLLFSPLRITISSTLERGADTLAAIWGSRVSRESTNCSAAHWERSLQGLTVL